MPFFLIHLPFHRFKTFFIILLRQKRTNPLFDRNYCLLHNDIVLGAVDEILATILKGKTIDATLNLNGKQRNTFYYKKTVKNI